MDNFAQIKTSIVKVITPTGTGSGFFLKDKNLIATNAHVIHGFRDVAIETVDRNRVHCKVLCINPHKDIALLMPTSMLNLPQLQLNGSVSPQLRDKISIVGYPLGLPMSVTEGIISSHEHMIRELKYIQTDAAVNPGNSGGPMFNQAGEVVGIATCKFSQAENISFALPISHVIHEVSSLDMNSQNFSVRCTACPQFLTEPIDYCPSCGVELQLKEYFEEKKISPFAEFVENALKSISINPVEARMGREFWEFYRGSALVRIFIYKGDYLYATCPLVNLPGENLAKFFSDILAETPAPYSLGLSKNTVFLSYRAYVANCLSAEHAQRAASDLAGLVVKADELDNLYIDKYKCAPSAFMKMQAAG